MDRQVEFFMNLMAPYTSDQLVPDKSPLRRVAYSILHPPIGSVKSSLHSLPSNSDEASKLGCKSQFYTSWNVSSRSFVSSISFSAETIFGVSSSDQTVQWKPRLRYSNASFNAHPIKSNLYSDILPVRIVGVTQKCQRYEKFYPVPYSSLFNVMKKMNRKKHKFFKNRKHLNTKYDENSMLLLQKHYMKKIPSSIFEVVPLVRLGCMSLSISKHCYETEIITRRIIRGFEQTAYLGCEITHETRRTPVSKILACTLEAFATFLNNNSKSMDSDNIFQYDKLDQEWTAVPISNNFVKQTSAVPYIASFMSSEFYNGKVNHVYRGYYSDANEKKKTEAVIRTIPAANSAFINGPKNVILVLVDHTNLCNDSYVKLLNFEVPIYSGEARVKPVSFSQIWDTWWCNTMLNNIDRDVILAMDEVEKHIAVKNAANIATSMLAELYTATYLGIAVHTDMDNINYNWNLPVCGGWSIYPNDSIDRRSKVKLNYWSRGYGNRAAERCRITGYNFSALTCWHRSSTGGVNTESQSSIFPNAGPMRVWSTTKPKSNCLPGYLITTVNSLTRICFYVKLLLTHGNRMNYKNCLGSRIHLLSVAMGAQVSLLFSQTNLSLSVWSGYFSESMQFLIINKKIMKTLVNGTTLGICRFSQQNIISNKYFKDTILEYYSIDPFNNVNWHSYTPYPHHLIQQWSTKINMVIGKQENFKFKLIKLNENFVIEFTSDTLQYRSKMACTINADQYFPLVLYKDLFRDNFCYDNTLMAWVDCWSYLSNISVTGAPVLTNKTCLESNELVFPVYHLACQRYIGRCICILRSSYAKYDIEETYFSNIKWDVHKKNQ